MNQVFYESVCDIVGSGNVLQGEPMSRHTTFRIGGEADFLIKPSSAEETARLIRYCRAVDMDYYVMGNGSNLLVGDKGYPGAIIQIYKNMSQCSIKGERITAGAGALLSQVAAKAGEHALSGMEFASGIPGTLGGAVVMDAGAYGGEMKDTVESVMAVTKDGEILRLSGDELDFGYRTSVFKKHPLVAVEVTLTLEPGDAEKIRERMEELKEKRASKQPLNLPSAGSAFKRPEGYYAGKLIMDAGLRGFSVGGAKVSEKHCGFIVNTGNATAGDVADLIAEIQERVFTRFGVRLEPEVCMLGEF